MRANAYARPHRRYQPLESVPRHDYFRLKEALKEFPRLFEANADRLGHLVGGHAGGENALLGLGSSTLIWVTVDHRSRFRSVAHLDVENVRSVLVSKPRTDGDRNRPKVDVVVVSHGLLIDLKDVPAGPGQAFGAAMEYQLQSRRHPRRD